MSGGDSEEVTPVPIPNTEVKLFSANGSWDFVPVRVGRCQALEKRLAKIASLFLYVHLSNKKLSKESFEP